MRGIWAWVAVAAGLAVAGCSGTSEEAAEPEPELSDVVDQETVDDVADALLADATPTPTPSPTPWSSGDVETDYVLSLRMMSEEASAPYSEDALIAAGRFVCITQAAGSSEAEIMVGLNDMVGYELALDVLPAANALLC